MRNFYEYAIALVFEWAVPILIATSFWFTFIVLSWALRG